MAARVSAAQSPPLAIIAPFFLLAPAGLFVAGYLATGAGAEVFVAINTHRTVAMTHALVLGWASLFLFGASYQLASAVLGGGNVNRTAARLHLVMHAVGVTLFVTALMRWEVWLMATGGGLVVASFLVFAGNLFTILRRTPRQSHPRSYMLVGLLFLVAGISLGLTFVGNFEHRWFLPSMGRLAAHAHLGLVGWMGLTIMGVSYQLVPMFNIVQKVKPRMPKAVLWLTAAGTVAFALVMATDPSRELRMLLALGIAIGPLLWMWDQLRLLWGRSRRKLDFHGQATFVSLAFLAMAIALGLAAAWGGSLHRPQSPASLPLAYGVMGLLGWMGTALLANSYKILPFLIWYHRHRPKMGIEPVPLVRDLLPERWPQLNLVLHAGAVVTVAAGALMADETVFRAGGALVALSAALHLGGMVYMFLPKHSSRGPVRTNREVSA